jgi:hypothetical protein
MLTFEKIASILETLRDRLDLDSEDLNEIDVLLSPLAAECEMYIVATDARIDTYERVLKIQAFGDADDTAMIFDPDEEDDDN